ncbi:methyltransferase domain-containing protein [Herbaspirillum rubrisubalbicans]|uniref:methyltransferase domain-containing protein n=1 Tax=Herbaspirillum rubrisubalbicans TaxID=80842 RepID=UPI00148BEFC9|nr:methyltransferase domain-containing protein [Herbaspirillum rubrisubalbicans]
MVKEKNYSEALNVIERAVGFSPACESHLENRAKLLLLSNREDEAVDLLQRLFELNQGNETIGFLLAMKGKKFSPPQAPASYVSELFNHYAQSFEEELIFKLQYKVPEELSRLLSSHRLDGFGAVLDLGCGTGLMGNYLSGHCSRLEGIDLAQEMLEVARKKECYDALHCTGITDYFSGIRFSGANTRFDVIAASDVFVYVGDLIDIFKGAFDTLDPGGLFAFSVEESEAEDYELKPSGRYGHSPKYIDRIAQESGFVLLEKQVTTLRHELGRGVCGILFLLGKPSFWKSPFDGRRPRMKLIFVGKIDRSAWLN